MLSGSVSTFRDARVRVVDDAGTSIAAFATGTDYGVPSDKALQAATFDAAGRVLVGGTSNGQSAPGAWLQRLRSDAIQSSTFVPLLPAQASPSGTLKSVFAIAIEPAGRIVTGGSTIVEGTGYVLPGQGSPRSVVTLRAGDGRADLGFGAVGEVVLAAPEGGRVRALGFDGGAIVVAHGTSSQLVLQRLDAHGTIDATFGTQGATSIEGWRSVAVDQRGRAYVLGGAGDNRTLTRYVAGRPDPSFAGTGTLSLAAPYGALAVGLDGAAYAARLEASNGLATLRATRVRDDGVVDAAYGTAGEAIATFTYDPLGDVRDLALAVADLDRHVAVAIRYTSSCLGFFCTTVTASMLFRFTGPSAPPATALAVEYVHAGFGHYFTTADADEIAALDAGVFTGWARTGESFTVAARSIGEAAPACRFFSGATFAPKSSHFYTPYPAECDIVDASADWSFEKIAYLLRVPDNVGAGDGTCPAGLRPLYRAYNRMQGGAPNHRYTTSAATLDAMIAQGWTFEGEANTRIFACVPA